MQKRLMPMVCAWMLLGCLATLGLSQQPLYPLSELMHEQSRQTHCRDVSRLQKLWAGNGCTAWATECGDLIEYVPADLADNPRLIVIVHGSIPSQSVAMDAAAMHIMRYRWHRFADRNGYILVAPVFDRHRYRGYRHLRGVSIGADEFVLRIAETYARIFDMPDSRFYLYGHSAGGQFAHRFLITHPDRVLGAVMSAPGNYANPVTSVSWPYGMDDSPNPLGFLRCTEVPSAVVVGSRDINPCGMGGEEQFGLNRVQRAKNWVRGMRRLAHIVGSEAMLDLTVVPGVAHSSGGLLDACTAEFSRILKHRDKLVRAVPE